jgi:hypothetical protein
MEPLAPRDPAEQTREQAFITYPIEHSMFRQPLHELSGRPSKPYPSQRETYQSFQKLHLAGIPSVRQFGYVFDFHWRYCAFRTASATRANGCKTKNGVHVNTRVVSSGLSRGVLRRMMDRVPQSCTSPESVKTIRDLRKFDMARRVVMVLGRSEVDEGIGCEGEVRPEPTGLGVVFVTDSVVGGADFGCADSPECVRPRIFSPIPIHPRTCNHLLKYPCHVCRHQHNPVQKMSDSPLTTW